MSKTINEPMAKIAINKSLLKEYTNSSNERIVYMNDGTEFQIQIFNPYTYNIGVSFTFNNDNKYLYNNDNLLVLKPGQRVWLERYLNDSSKLLFSTYEVSNLKKVKEAIKSNGVLTIKFYKEKENFITYYQPYYYNYNNSSNIKLCDIYDNNGYNIGDIKYCNTLSAQNYVNSITTAELISSPVSTSASTSASTSTSFALNNNPKTSKSIETGRIEKGSYSNQKFNTINMDFENWPFTTETIHILPSSQKPITTNDLQKVYCSNCGRKLNQKYKFCPYCGIKIEECKSSKNKKYELIKCPYCGRTVRSNMMECPHCGEILK